MSQPPRNSRHSRWDSVRVDGRSYPVIDRVRTAGRVWPVLERMGADSRQQFKVFDQFAGSRGGFRTLHRLPVSDTSWQHIEVLRRISTTNSQLPTILECRRESGFFVLIVSWLNGSTLREYLNAVQSGHRPPTSPTEAIRLIRGLAHGVSQLHRHRQIVHGDLRPENLLLTSRPSRLVMIDLGSAWMAESASQRQIGDGFVPGYTAPELQGPDAVTCRDYRCDQFSTGVMLFELLTGQLPYDGLGGQVLQLADQKQAATRWCPPSQLLLDRRRIPQRLRDGIDAHVATSLSLDPDDRFATPAAWLDSLDTLHLGKSHSLGRRNESWPLTGVVSWLAELSRVVASTASRVRERRAVGGGRFESYQ